MDEAGPFMAPPAGDAELENEDTGVWRLRPIVPAKPDWLDPAGGAAAGTHGDAPLGRERGKGCMEGACARGDSKVERRWEKRGKKEKKEAVKNKEK